MPELQFVATTYHAYGSALEVQPQIHDILIQCETGLLPHASCTALIRPHVEILGPVLMVRSKDSKLYHNETAPEKGVPLIAAFA